MSEQKTTNQIFLDLLNQIRFKQSNFSSAQRLVASYVLDNYHLIPFLSISTLAENIGVSSNSIIKFCNQLGFEKFTEFKKIFSDHAHTELTAADKADESATNQQDTYFAQGLESDTVSIHATLNNPANQENLPKAVEMIMKASHIYIAGGMRSYSFASFLAGNLRYMGLRTHALTCGTNDYWQNLRMATPEDLVIVISLPRHNPENVEHLKKLRKGGVPVIAITDTGLSPILPYSDLAFYCSLSTSYYLPSCAGVLSLIDVISRAVSHQLDQEKFKHQVMIEG